MREALKLALEALEKWDARGRLRVITAIKQALARPEQEPAVFARRWKLAIDGFGLQRDDDNGNYVDIEDALLVLHHLLSAQPEQKPYGWIDVYGHFWNHKTSEDDLPLYTTSPKREWVELTDDEIKTLWIQYRAALPRYLCFAKAIESKSKEKNT